VAGWARRRLKMPISRKDISFLLFLCNEMTPASFETCIFAAGKTKPNPQQQ
jgi:hypothetical protein